MPLRLAPARVIPVVFNSDRTPRPDRRHRRDRSRRRRRHRRNRSRARASPRAGPRRRTRARRGPARRSDVDRWGRSEHLRARSAPALRPDLQALVPRRVGGLRASPRPKVARCSSPNHAGAIPPDAPVDHARHRDATSDAPCTAWPRTCSAAMPVIGTLWSRSGGVAAHPDNAYRLLHDEQQLVLVFPEGTKGTGKHFSRSVPAAPVRAGRLRRDRDARRRAGHSRSRWWAPRRRCRSSSRAPASRRYSTSRTSRSPRTCCCSARSGSWAYFPAKFKIRVLPPVHFDVPPNQERYSRSRVMDESERIRRMVQDALYDMLRTRRSVWFG